MNLHDVGSYKSQEQDLVSGPWTASDDICTCQSFLWDPLTQETRSVLIITASLACYRSVIQSTHGRTNQEGLVEVNNAVSGSTRRSDFSASVSSEPRSPNQTDSHLKSWRRQILSWPWTSLLLSFRFHGVSSPPHKVPEDNSEPSPANFLCFSEVKK